RLLPICYRHPCRGILLFAQHWIGVVFVSSCGMKRDGGNGLDSSSPDGSCAALAMDPPRSKPDRSRVLAGLRYGSADFQLLVGAVALVLGGWATWWCSRSRSFLARSPTRSAAMTIYRLSKAGVCSARRTSI